MKKKLEWNVFTCKGIFDDGGLTDNFKAKVSLGISIPETNELDFNFKKLELMMEDDELNEMETLNLNQNDKNIHHWMKSNFNNTNVIEGECRNGIRHGFKAIYEKGVLSKVGLFERGVMVNGVNVLENGYLQKFSKTMLELELESINSNSTNRKSEPDKSKKDDGSLFLPHFEDNKFEINWNQFEDSDVYEKGQTEFQGKDLENIFENKSKKYQLKISKSELFEGFIMNGKPEGQGIYLNSDKNIKYSGEWKNGKRHGNGCMRFENQEMYNGEGSTTEPLERNFQIYQ